MQADTQEKVSQLVKELTHLFNEKLLSVCVYGSSLFQQNLPPAKKKLQDINVLVILSSLTPSDLERASSVAKWWEKTANALPLFFAEEEWQRTSDAFALEYADIRDNHHVAYGKDYFSQTEVDCQALRLVLELELNRKLIFLRQRLLMQRDKPKVLLEIMQNSINSIAALFRGILRLTQSQSAIPQNPADVFTQLKAVISDYDAQPFLTILELKGISAKIHQTQMGSLYNQYIQQIALVTVYVDQCLPEKSLVAEGV